MLGFPNIIVWGGSMCWKRRSWRGKCLESCWSFQMKLSSSLLGSVWKIDPAVGTLCAPWLSVRIAPPAWRGRLHPQCYLGWVSDRPWCMQIRGPPWLCWLLWSPVLCTCWRPLESPCVGFSSSGLWSLRRCRIWPIRRFCGKTDFR